MEAAGGAVAREPDPPPPRTASAAGWHFACLSPPFLSPSRPYFFPPLLDGTFREDPGVLQQGPFPAGAEDLELGGRERKQEAKPAQAMWQCPRGLRATCGLELPLPNPGGGEPCPEVSKGSLQQGAGLAGLLRGRPAHSALGPSHSPGPGLHPGRLQKCPQQPRTWLTKCFIKHVMVFIYEILAAFFRGESKGPPGFLPPMKLHPTHLA